jgi:hypothetical protein
VPDAGIMLNPMRVDSTATVAGYPVLLVRQALRKLRHIDTWASGMLEAAAGLHAGAGPELAKALAARGLIRKLQKDTWTICQAGMTFAAATAAKPLTRATAERALAAFMERVARVNSDPYFLGRVTRVALFGSMLSPDTDRPSDVDLAVEVGTENHGLGQPCREESQARAAINQAGPPFPTHDRVCRLLAPGGLPVP